MIVDPEEVPKTVYLQSIGEQVKKNTQLALENATLRAEASALREALETCITFIASLPPSLAGTLVLNDARRILTK